MTPETRERVPEVVGLDARDGGWGIDRGGRRTADPFIGATSDRRRRGGFAHGHMLAILIARCVACSIEGCRLLGDGNRQPARLVTAKGQVIRPSTTVVATPLTHLLSSVTGEGEWPVGGPGGGLVCASLPGKPS